MKILDRNSLIPAAWREQAGHDDCFVFNPAITRFRDALLLAYRVVLADGRRRLALCRLDAALEVIPGSVIALSDAIQGAGDWLADGRFCVFGERLLLHFNSGSRPRPNQIWCVELHAETLLPLTPAKPLLLQGARQAVEKNWMLFEHGGELLAVYRIAPHTILRLQETDTAFICLPQPPLEWPAEAWAGIYGQLRGSTPPVRVDDAWFCFFHSVWPLPRWRRALHRLLYGRGHRTWRYGSGFYGFSADARLQPLCFSPQPVLHASARKRRQALNPRADRVIYPCGAVFQDGNWIVSYGLNDEHCCLQILPHAGLLAKTVAVTPVAQTAC